MRVIAGGLLAVVVVALASLFSLAPAFAAVIEVSSGSYYFEDSTRGDGKIVANVGDQLRVVTEDAGKGTPHTVEVAELGISSGPLGTNSTYVTPVLSTPGTFRLFCKPHQNKGHWTTLVVVGEPTTTTTTTTAPPPTSTVTTTTTQPPTSTTTTRPTVTTTSTVLASTTTTEGAVASSTSSTVGPSFTTPASGTDEGAIADDTIPLSSEPSPGEGPPLDEPDQATVLTSGVTESEETLWLRSVWIGLWAVVPLAGMALVVIRRAGRFAG